jgi:hypothetical protein
VPDLPVGIRIVRSITQEAASLGKFADGIVRGDPVALRQRHKLIAVIRE